MKTSRLSKRLEVIGAQPFEYVREALERSLSATGSGASDLGDQLVARPAAFGHPPRALHIRRRKRL